MSESIDANPAEEAALKSLKAVLKQAKLVSEHKGEMVNIGCAIIELAQAGELQLQLGEGTFELMTDEYFARLDDFARSNDQVIRLSDRRAMVIMQGLTSQDPLDLAAAKLNRLMTPPITIVNNSVLVKTNAGLAMAGADKMSAHQLYSAATSAIERSHADQRFVIYNPQSIDAEADSWHLKVELEQALHQGEIFPYFEPVLATTYSNITAAAARMVWHSPSRGVVPFEKVAQCAAETDLSRPLSWHFLKTVIGQAAHWDDSIMVIIPLDETAFSDDCLLQELEDALAIYGLPHTRITICAPESVLIDPVGRQVLDSLRRIGVAVRIRDVGLGGLPLHTLGEFPADEVSFTPSIIGKQTPPKIKQAIFALMKATGVNLVALNVKDTKLIRKYKELGFSSVQGPAVAPIMKPDAFTKWLKIKVGAVG